MNHWNEKRLPWKDSFNTPSVQELRSDIEEAGEAPFDTIRAYLLETPDVTETLIWFGPCWQWTIAYMLPGLEDPMAILIPAPEDVQMAIPLPPGFIESVPFKRLKRAIRDGLDLGASPFDTTWAVWSIPAAGLLDDLKEIIRYRLRHLASLDSK